MEVPLQSHRSQRPARLLVFPVQVARRIAQPILLIHQPICRVGRAMGSGALLSRQIVSSTRTQVQDPLEYHASQPPLCPFAQSPQALGELTRRLGLATTPDPIQDLLAQRAAAALLHLQDPVQEPQDQTHGREQLPPGQASRVEAVGRDRLWRVSPIEFLRLLLELAVGFAEFCGAGVARPPDAQTPPSLTVVATR